MYTVWNLDPIYHGFDDPCFEADLEKLNELSAEYAALTAQLEKLEPL